MLEQLAGAWDTTMKVEGKDVKGTQTFRTDLGGFWVTGTLESDLFGAKFTGKSVDGYDPIKKKYVSIWTDSMSPTPVIMEGTYDKEKKTLSMAGDGPGHDGKAAKYRSETKFVDKDTIEMSMWIGDGKDPMFALVYKRRK